MEQSVLLIDDDQAILQGLVRALRRQPYELFTAASGEEALLVLKTHNVDVVVVDEHMPGMRGGDLLVWIAEHFPEVMRIVLTGHPTVETAIRAINEGRVHQFFTKPCNPAHLGMAIRKALEHKRLERDNCQLAELNQRQMQEIERYKEKLEAMTSVVCRDVRAPLRSISRCCQTLEKQYENDFNAGQKALVDRALGGVMEVVRLIEGLKEHCREKTRESAARELYSEDETRRAAARP